jgi:hypothetical protein
MTLAAAALSVRPLTAAPLAARLRMMRLLARGAVAAIETTLTRAAARSIATSLLVLRVRARGEGEG